MALESLLFVEQQVTKIAFRHEPPLPLPQMQALLGKNKVDVKTWAMLQTGVRKKALRTQSAPPNP